MDFRKLNDLTIRNSFSLSNHCHFRSAGKC